MAPGDLADELQALSLCENSEYLLFNPTGDKTWLKERFNHIPRYLFRVSTPKSETTTDRFWVKSKDAKCASVYSRVDILAQGDNQQVARMLNGHLNWEHNDTNLVSWTSSLLFACQLIFYRHNHWKDGSSLDEIDLYIIDTATFPKGVFLRDMDLIHAYQSFEPDLQDFENLRNKRHYYFAGSYYFGEYLSQGALRIEGKCQTVSAQAILDHGLFVLQPDLKKSLETQDPKLANEVVRLREVFYQNEADRQPTTSEELQAMIDIAQLFGSPWRFPIAANLIALRPRQRGDSAILHAFRTQPFTDDERQDCSPSRTKVEAFDTLPEVKQFDEIVRDVYADFLLTKLKDCISGAEAELRRAIIHDDQIEHPKLDSAHHRDLLQRIDTIMTLGQVLRVHHATSTRSPE